MLVGHVRVDDGCRTPSSPRSCSLSRSYSSLPGGGRFGGVGGGGVGDDEGGEEYYDDEEWSDLYLTNGEEKPETIIQSLLQTVDNVLYTDTLDGVLSPISSPPPIVRTSITAATSTAAATSLVDSDVPPSQQPVRFPHRRPVASYLEECREWTAVFTHMRVEGRTTQNTSSTNETKRRTSLSRRTSRSTTAVVPPDPILLGTTFHSPLRSTTMKVDQLPASSPSSSSELASSTGMVHTIAATSHQAQVEPLSNDDTSFLKIRPSKMYQRIDFDTSSRVSSRVSTSSREEDEKKEHRHDTYGDGADDEVFAYDGILEETFAIDRNDSSFPSYYSSSTHESGDQTTDPSSATIERRQDERLGLPPFTPERLSKYELKQAETLEWYQGFVRTKILEPIIPHVTRIIVKAYQKEKKDGQKQMTTTMTHAITSNHGVSNTDGKVDSTVVADHEEEEEEEEVLFFDGDTAMPNPFTSESNPSDTSHSTTAAAAGTATPTGGTIELYRLLKLDSNGDLRRTTKKHNHKSSNIVYQIQQHHQQQHLHHHRPHSESRIGFVNSSSSVSRSSQRPNTRPHQQQHHHQQQHQHFPLHGHGLGSTSDSDSDIASPSRRARHTHTMGDPWFEPTHGTDLHETILPDDLNLDDEDSMHEPLKYTSPSSHSRYSLSHSASQTRRAGGGGGGGGVNTNNGGVGGVRVSENPLSRCGSRSSRMMRINRQLSRTSTASSIRSNLITHRQDEEDGEYDGDVYDDASFGKDDVHSSSADSLNRSFESSAAGRRLKTPPPPSQPPQGVLKSHLHKMHEELITHTSSNKQEETTTTKQQQQLHQQPTTIMTNGKPISIEVEHVDADVDDDGDVDPLSPLDPIDTPVDVDVDDRSTIPPLSPPNVGSSTIVSSLPSVNNVVAADDVDDAVLDGLSQLTIRLQESKVNHHHHNAASSASSRQQQQQQPQRQQHHRSTSSSSSSSSSSATPFQLHPLHPQPLTPTLKVVRAITTTTTTSATTNPTTRQMRRHSQTMMKESNVSHVDTLTPQQRNRRQYLSSADIRRNARTLINTPMLNHRFPSPTPTPSPLPSALYGSHTSSSSSSSSSSKSISRPRATSASGSNKSNSHTFLAGEGVGGDGTTTTTPTMTTGAIGNIGSSIQFPPRSLSRSTLTRDGVGVLLASRSRGSLTLTPFEAASIQSNININAGGGGVGGGLVDIVNVGRRSSMTTTTFHQTNEFGSSPTSSANPVSRSRATSSSTTRQKRMAAIDQPMNNDPSLTNTATSPTSSTSSTLASSSPTSSSSPHHHLSQRPHSSHASSSPSSVNVSSSLSIGRSVPRKLVSLGPVPVHLDSIPSPSQHRIHRMSNTSSHVGTFHHAGLSLSPTPQSRGLRKGFVRLATTTTTGATTTLTTTSNNNNNSNNHLSLLQVGSLSSSIFVPNGGGGLPSPHHNNNHHHHHHPHTSHTANPHHSTSSTTSTTNHHTTKQSRKVPSSSSSTSSSTTMKHKLPVRTPSMLRAAGQPPTTTTTTTPMTISS